MRQQENRKADQNAALQVVQPISQGGRRYVSRISGREHGAGTVLTLGIGLVLLVLLAATVMLVQASVAASKAATAADLAALAAADTARGLRSGDPCSVATETASRHGASVLSCEQSGPGGHIVEIRTAVDAAMVLPDATGRARAGPPP